MASWFGTKRRRTPPKRYSGTTAGGTSFSTVGKGSRTDLEGVADLEAALRAVGEDLQGEALRSAIAAGAEITRNVASQLAPVSPDGTWGHSRGFLSRNIRAIGRWTKTQNTADIHVGMTKDAWYGRFAETGTAFSPAQPFLRPALDETKNDVIDEIAEQLRNRILRG